MSDMRATILIDNIAEAPLCGEWGLAVYIEYKGRKILLDAGSSGSIVKNAERLGIDLSAVEYGVLSHAHYDHADGICAFFGANSTAQFYMREGTAEDCYGKKWIFSKYIGIKRGMLEKFSDRITYVGGDFELCPGGSLIPHKTEGLAALGKRAGMYRKPCRHWEVDDFKHEQSLVLDTEKGLVIFNSCSHGGADNIIREVGETYPDKKIYALVGGLHLFSSTENEVLDVAKRINETGIQKVVTGHCTGDKAFKLLKRELGDRVEQLRTGFVLEA